MNFFIGCAVWSYKGWVGDFYPTGSRPSEFLDLYSQRLTTVEGNTTFYAIPDQDTVKRWATQTPAGFEFCLKLPKQITHNGLLQPAIPEALSFLEQMQGLGKHLGPIFAQLPPNYDPNLLEDLTIFLEAWPRHKALLALEVRHPNWFKEPYSSKLTAVLEKLGVARVLLDSRPVYSEPNNPQLHAQRRKPQLPLQPIVTAPFSLVRFISHPEQEINQTFLEEWVVLIEQWLRQGTSVYFFVHCPVEERSPSIARYFQQLLEQHGVSVPPLPWNSLNSSPQQLSLF